MSEQTSLRIARSPDKQPNESRSGRTLSAKDKRDLFKALVIGSLDAGFLRYSQRQELLRIAAQLGFEEFEACLLIAEAQFHSDAIDPADAGQLEAYDVAPVARQASFSMPLGSALLAAALVDAIIIVWLL